MLACGEREAMLMAPLPMRNSAVSPCFHRCLAFLHLHFPLRAPDSHPLGPSLHSQQQPSPWDCFTLPSSSQTLCLPGTCVPLRGMYDCGKDCLILIPFRLPQISCFTLSLKCFSSDSDNFPDVGIGPLLQFPDPPRASPFLLTLLLSPLVPLSYRVLHGFVYYFPLVRYSCALSADVMHALLCLKVYSWCNCGERCSPHPPTPPPSCSPYNLKKKKKKKLFWRQSGKNHHVLLLQLLQKLLTGTPVSTCTLPQIVQPATQSF